MTTFKLSSIKRYTNIAEFIKQGQKQAFLRNEPQDHPCNAIPVPEEVLLYIAEVSGGKPGMDERFRAYIEVTILPTTPGISHSATQGVKRIEVASGKTRTEVLRDLSFSLGYSMYADSTWYRAFRSAYGYSERSAPYQSQEQQVESQRRMLGVMTVMAGAI